MQVSISLHRAGKKLKYSCAQWASSFQFTVVPTKILLAQKVYNFYSLPTKTTKANFTGPPTFHFHVPESKIYLPWLIGPGFFLALHRVIFMCQLTHTRLFTLRTDHVIQRLVNLMRIICVASRYSLIAVMKDRIYLVNSWPFLVRYSNHVLRVALNVS